MPVITVNASPLNSVEKKRQLVNELTDIVAKIYELPKDAIIVLIDEYPRENIGVAGKLLIDTK